MDLNGNVIYAVDFDGTLSFGRFPGAGDPNDNLFRFLKAEQERGGALDSEYLQDRGRSGGRGGVLPGSRTGI